MSVIFAEEADRLYEIDRAVQEWKEARRAVLSYPFKKEPDAEQLELWRCLGDAEDALMKAGEGY